MKKIQKGTVGYLHFRKIQTMIAMIVGYMLVLLLFYTGIFMYADRKNLLTLAAVLMCLPSAKMTVQFLMYPKKGTASKEEYDEIAKRAKNMKVLADMLITPEKKSIEIAYAVVGKKNIIMYSPDKKLDVKYHTDFVKKFFKGIDIYSDVAIYGGYEQFKKRVSGIAVNEPEQYSEEEALYIAEAAHNLLILSI